MKIIIRNGDDNQEAKESEEMFKAMKRNYHSCVSYKDIQLYDLAPFSVRLFPKTYSVFVEGSVVGGRDMGGSVVNGRVVNGAVALMHATVQTTKRTSTPAIT